MLCIMLYVHTGTYTSTSMLPSQGFNFYSCSFPVPPISSFTLRKTSNDLQSPFCCVASLPPFKAKLQ